MATLENRITKLEQQRGGTGFMLVTLDDGETEAEARKRVGLLDWPGVIVFLDKTDQEI